MFRRAGEAATRPTVPRRICTRVSEGGGPLAGSDRTLKVSPATLVNGSTSAPRSVASFRAMSIPLFSSAVSIREFRGNMRSKRWQAARWFTPRDERHAHHTTKVGRRRFSSNQKRPQFETTGNRAIAPVDIPHWRPHFLARSCDLIGTPIPSDGHAGSSHLRNEHKKYTPGGTARWFYPRRRA